VSAWWKTSWPLAARSGYFRGSPGSDLFRCHYRDSGAAINLPPRKPDMSDCPCSRYAPSSPECKEFSSGYRKSLIRAAPNTALPWQIRKSRCLKVEKIFQEGAKHFSLKHSAEFLPISNSRGQLSLDSSPTQSTPKQHPISPIHRNLLTTFATPPSAMGRTRVPPGAALRRSENSSSWPCAWAPPRSAFSTACLADWRSGPNSYSRKDPHPRPSD
jgi:hypothetical protein